MAYTILQDKKNECTTSKYVLEADSTGDTFYSKVKVISMPNNRHSIKLIDKMEQDKDITSFYANELRSNMYDVDPKPSYFIHDPQLNSNLTSEEFVQYMNALQVTVPFTSEDSVADAIRILKRVYNRLFYRNIKPNVTDG